MTPAMGVVPIVNVNVVEVIEDGSTGSLKVALTALPRLMPEAVSEGLVETTLGQTPVRPATSVTFLQPTTKTAITNNISHLLVKILEQVLRNKVPLTAEGVFFIVEF